MKKVTVSTLLVVILLLLSIGTAAAAPRGKTAFKASLSGAAAGSNSDARGRAVFVFANDGSKMKFKLVVKGLDNPTMAHIHVAPAPGENGPPVLWLYPDAPPPVLFEGTFNGVLGRGRVTSADLTGAAGITSLAELRMAIEEGRAYVNVHTSAFPGGEIRGDIH